MFNVIIVCLSLIPNNRVRQLYTKNEQIFLQKFALEPHYAENESSRGVDFEKFYNNKYKNTSLNLINMTKQAIKQH